MDYGMDGWLTDGAKEKWAEDGTVGGMIGRMDENSDVQMKTWAE